MNLVSGMIMFLDIQQMFLSINQIDQKVENDELSNDIDFLKKLIRDESFQVFLSIFCIDNNMQFVIVFLYVAYM